MGRTTRFHPVSLRVIHGAAEFSGFRIGKLRQTDVNEPEGTAQYDAPIISMPKDVEQANPKTIQHRLDSAFSSDVGVLSVWITRRGTWMCSLETLNGEALDRQARRAELESEAQAMEESDIPF